MNRDKIAAAAACIALAGASVFTAVTTAGASSARGKDAVVIAGLERQLSEAVAQAQRQTQVGELAAAGIDAEQADAASARISADTALLTKVVRLALTWDSDASYMGNRDQLRRTYKIGDDSGLLTTFMPEAPANVDADGKRYPYIDVAGLNSKMTDVTVTLSSVEGTRYGYLVLADATTTTPSGKGSMTVTDVFQAVVGADGILEISGSGTNQVSRSGAVPTP